MTLPPLPAHAAPTYRAIFITLYRIDRAHHQPRAFPPANDRGDI